jgi:type IV pilus assembly protein PilB
VPVAHQETPRIGDLIVGHQLAPREVVEQLAEEAQAAGRRISEMLVQRGGVAEPEIYRLLAEQHGLAFATASSLMVELDSVLTRDLSRAYLERHHVVPIARKGSVLVVASSEPNVATRDLLVALRASSLEVRLVTPTDFRRLLSWTQRAPLTPGQTDPAVSVGGGGDSLSELQLLALLDALILEAVGERASDLHIERQGASAIVRLRVDGDLRTLNRFPLAPSQADGIINVLKVKARLDIAEHRLPQGGRFQATIAGRSYDMRVQVQPTCLGENAVLRLLQQVPDHTSLEGLGMSSAQAQLVRRTLASPQGLALVVGPTGSGKSTTLYCGLRSLSNDSRLKVLTIEDPVEYLIPGAQQSAVRPEIGFGFAEAMRAFVRQDPDVIMLGEVRDQETALEAMRASQTGHLVLTTLHCTDSLDALQRLRSLGADPDAIAGELQLVVAQRLVQRICLACREETRPTPEIVTEVFGGHPPADLRVFHGRGCTQCRGTGTQGRVGVFEVLPFGRELRLAVAQRAPLDTFREIAMSAGLISLRDSMIELAQQGVIAFDSLAHALPLDRLGSPRRPSAS